MTIKSHTVYDQETEVTFDGELLAYATSAAVGKDRWSELWVYKTVAGQYIVHGIGRSLVPGETDRVWCNVVTSGQGVIDRLTRREGDVRFMPRMPNRAVAEEAAKRDPDIAAAYYTNRVA